MNKLTLYLSLLFSALLISSCTKNQYEKMVIHSCDDTATENNTHRNSDSDSSDESDDTDDNGSITNDGTDDSTEDTDLNITDPNNDPDSRRKKKQ